MATLRRSSRKRSSDGDEVQLTVEEKRAKNFFEDASAAYHVDPHDESFEELHYNDLESEISEALQQQLAGIYVATEGNQAFKWHSMNPFQVLTAFRTQKCSDNVEVCMTAGTVPRLASPRYDYQHRHYVVDIWDLSNNTLVRTFGKLSRGSKIRLNSAATALAVTDGKTLCVWDIESESKIWSIELNSKAKSHSYHYRYTSDLHFILNDERLVAVSQGRTLFLDAVTGKEIANWQNVDSAGATQGCSIAVDSTGLLISRCLGGESIAIHNLATSMEVAASVVWEKRVDSFLSAGVKANSITFIGQDRFVLTHNRDVYVWNFQTETMIAKISTHCWNCRVAFSAASNLLLCFGGYSQDVLVFDADTGAAVCENQIKFSSTIQGVYCQQAATILM